MASIVADLPSEILVQIFGNGDRTVDLKNYAVVCSTWRFPAQEALFSSFTITNLFSSSPHALPYSAMGNNEQHAHIRRYIRQLTLNIPEPGPVDPEFPAFLRHLTAVQKLSFLNGGDYFFKDNYTPEMQEAITHLLSLPSLAFLKIGLEYFPIHLITSCVNLKHLTIAFVGFNSFPARLSDHFSGEAHAPIRLRTLSLVGSAALIALFTSTVLREPRFNISLDQLSIVNLCFIHTLPYGTGTIFSLFGSVEYMNIFFQINHDMPAPNPVLPVDAADLKGLTNIRAIKFSFPCTQHPAKDFDHTKTLVSQWILPFLHRFPKSPMLHRIGLFMMSPSICSLQMDQLLPYAQTHRESFLHIWEELDMLLSAESDFPGLSTFSFYVPWMRSRAELLQALPKCARYRTLESYLPLESST